jgi:hypothetical protein
MSIYATRFIVDEETGEVKTIKHLNKVRVDRGKWNRTPGGWGKSGSKARLKKVYHGPRDRSVDLDSE